MKSKWLTPRICTITWYGRFKNSNDHFEIDDRKKIFNESSSTLVYFTHYINASSLSAQHADVFKSYTEKYFCVNTPAKKKELFAGEVLCVVKICWKKPISLEKSHHLLSLWPVGLECCELDDPPLSLAKGWGWGGTRTAFVMMVFPTFVTLSPLAAISWNMVNCVTFVAIAQDILWDFKWLLKVLIDSKI